MIVVAVGWLSPELVEAVQRFRGAIYAADGAVTFDGDRHIEAADAESYHVVLLRDGEIKACLRYQQIRNHCARIGGWAVAAELRGTRAAVRIALEAVRLAERLGDQSGVAKATVRHGSADILRKMGGRLIFRYWDADYGCEMDFLEFHLPEMKSRRPLAA